MPSSMPSWPGMRSVSPDLGFSMWRRGLHAKGGIHKPERPSRSQPARQCGSTQARQSKMLSIHRLRKGPPGRRLHHERNPRCGSKLPLDPLWRLFLGDSAFAQASQKTRFDLNRVWLTVTIGEGRIVEMSAEDANCLIPAGWTLLNESGSDLAADLNLDAAFETKRIIDSEGGICVAVAGDVSLADDVAAIVDACITAFGQIHVLHNNVGIVE